jgi:hypothetical protein
LVVVVVVVLLPGLVARMVASDLGAVPLMPLDMESYVRIAWLSTARLVFFSLSEWALA